MIEIEFADVVKLVDTPDLGSGAERCAGSSPSIRTSKMVLFSRGHFLFVIVFKIEIR